MNDKSDLRYIYRPDDRVRESLQVLQACLDVLVALNALKSLNRTNDY